LIERGPFSRYLRSGSVAELEGVSGSAWESGSDEWRTLNSPGELEKSLVMRWAWY
jgi:hypothetical protein